jgi:hypothetical protein
VKGHGSKFGRKKEEAIAALLTQRNNNEEAAKSVLSMPNLAFEGFGPNNARETKLSIT